MRKPLLTALVSAWLVLAGPAHGQKDSLLIGPGDLLQIDVADTPGMEQQVRVTDQGMIDLEYIGNVRVEDQTPGAAAAVIEQALIAKQVMRSPQVTVRVEEYATEDVSVLGQVKEPGAYPLTTPESVVRVLSLAGGLTDAADRQVTIKRHATGQEITYYLSNDPAVALMDPPRVDPGDTVLVPKAPLIYIMGDVNRPGGYYFTTNDTHLTVMQAIALAGSASRAAVPKKLRLIRQTPQGLKETRINLEAITKGKEPDIALKPNDVLYMPFSWMKNIALNGSTIAASTAGAAVYALP